MRGSLGSVFTAVKIRSKSSSIALIAFSLDVFNQFLSGASLRFVAHDDADAFERIPESIERKQRANLKETRCHVESL